MEDTQNLLERNNIFGFFKLGMDTVADKPYLILFPLGLDFLLLFGPKVGVSSLIGKLIDSVGTPQLAESLLAQWQVMMEVLRQNIQHFNLTSVLSTKPLGIPSLFSNRFFETNLLPNQPGLELTAFWQIFVFAALFFLIGIGLTFLYYSLTASGSIGQAKAITINRFLQKAPRFLAIPFIFLAMVIVYFLPGMFIVSFFTVILPLLGIILYVVLIVTFFFFLTPLLFTPHAIIAHDENVRNAMKISSSTISPIRGQALLFWGTAIGMTLLTNLLWNLAKDGSWFLIIGVLGHAIVASIILAASFHFFSAAEALLINTKKSSTEPIQTA